MFVYKNTVMEKRYPQVLMMMSSVLSADLMLGSLLGHGWVNAACCVAWTANRLHNSQGNIKTIKDMERKFKSSISVVPKLQFTKPRIHFLIYLPMFSQLHKLCSIDGRMNVS